MPRVGRLIAQPARQGRRAFAGDFGGGAGEAAIGQALGQIGQTAEALFAADMEARVSRAVAESSAELNELTFQLEADPDYLSHEEQYNEGRQKILNRFREGLATERFRNVFDDRAFPIAEHLGLRVKENVRAKQLDHTRGSTLVAVEQFAKLAAEAESDDLREEYMNAAMSLLQRGQEGGAFTAAQVANAQNGFERALAEADERRQSQEIADELMRTVPNQRDRLRIAREQYSGTREDNVIARLKDQWAEQEAITRQNDEARFDAAVKSAMAGELTHAEALELDLSGRQRITVESVIDQQRKGAAVAPGGDLYWGLRNEAATPGTRQRFLNRDLNQVAHRMTPRELADLKADQLKGEGGLDDWPRKVQQALPELQLGKGQASMSKTEGLRLRTFRSNVDAAKKREEALLNRPLKQEEMDAIISKGVEQVIVDEGFFTSTTRGRFEVILEDIKDIPDEALAQVREALRLGANNTNPTEMQIKEQYQRMLFEDLIQ
jgi:hypothetical protein